MRPHRWRWAGGMAVFLLGAGVFASDVEAQDQGYRAMTTEADFLRAMDELSNWGRWGADDELGAANLITPAKRRAAAALVTEGISVSLAHDVVQETALDATTILDREVLRISATGAADQYQYTGSYHGVIHSHLDAVDCHIMYEGKGYNGVAMEEIEEAGGCPRGASTPSRTASSRAASCSMRRSCRAMPPLRGGSNPGLRSEPRTSRPWRRSKA